MLHNARMKTKSVLVVMHTGFEEAEAVVPIDLMRRAGIEVTVASCEDNLELTSRGGVKIVCETLISKIGNQNFDCIMLPGGPGVAALRKNQKVNELLLAQNKKKGSIAAICAAPLVLHDLKIIEGKKVTGYYSIKEEIPGLIENLSVVVDGNVITSRGPGTAFAFGFAIIESLLGKAKTDEIKKETHYI